MGTTMEAKVPHSLGCWCVECEPRRRAENVALELLEACKRLLKFNEELCADVGVSTHYPSADFARAVIAKTEPPQ